MQATTYSEIETWQTDIDNGRLSDASANSTALSVHTDLGLLTGAEPGRQIAALAVSGDFIELITTTLQADSDGLYWEIPEAVVARFDSLGDGTVQTWYWFENTDPPVDYDSLSSPVADIVSENIETLDSKWVHITQYELYYDDSTGRLSGKTNIPAYPIQHHFDITTGDELTFVVVNAQTTDTSIEKFNRVVRKEGKITVPKQQREQLGLSRENRTIELWAELGDVFRSGEKASPQSVTDSSASGEDSDNSTSSTATITFNTGSESAESTHTTTESTADSEPDADASGQAETAGEAVSDAEQENTDKVTGKSNTAVSESTQTNGTEEATTATATPENSTVDSSSGDDLTQSQTTGTTSIRDVIASIETAETITITDVAVEMNPDSEPVVLLDDSERLRENWPLHYRDADDELFCGREYTDAVTDYARDHGTAVCVDCLLERPGTLSATDIVTVLEAFAGITVSPSFPIVLDKEDSAALAATLAQLGLHETE